MNRARRTLSPFALLVLGSACFDLDANLHSNQPCSRVTTATCEEPTDPWNRTCVPCDQPYDWARSYDWVSGTWARPAVNVKQLSIATRDGRATLDAYFLPSHGENPALTGTTVLYHHGNNKSIEHYLPRVRFLHEAGFAVLVWDYRGYGKSRPETTPTGAQLFDDAEDVRLQLEGLGVDPDRIVHYGYSLGALPAVDLTQRRPPCALLLEAPLPSVELIVEASSQTSIPGSFLGSGDYDNERKLADIEEPVFIMIGTRDARFEVEKIERLYDAAAGPKRFWQVEGAEHGVGKGIPETAGLNAYFDQIESFLSEVAPACLDR